MGLNGASSVGGLGNPSPGYDREVESEFFDFILGINAFETECGSFLPNYCLDESGNVFQYWEDGMCELEGGHINIMCSEESDGVLYGSEVFDEYWEDYSEGLDLYEDDDGEYDDILEEYDLFELELEDCFPLQNPEEEVFEKVWSGGCCGFDGSVYKLTWDCGVGQEEAEPSPGLSPLPPSLSPPKLTNISPLPQLKILFGNLASGGSLMDQSLEKVRCRQLRKYSYYMERKQKLETLWKLARVGLDSGIVKSLLGLRWLVLQTMRDRPRPKPPLFTG